MEDVVAMVTTKVVVALEAGSAAATIAITTTMEIKAAEPVSITVRFHSISAIKGTTTNVMVVTMAIKETTKIPLKTKAEEEFVSTPEREMISTTLKWVLGLSNGGPNQMMRGEGSRRDDTISLGGDVIPWAVTLFQNRYGNNYRSVTRLDWQIPTSGIFLIAAKGLNQHISRLHVLVVKPSFLREEFSSNINLQLANKFQSILMTTCYIVVIISHR